MTRLTTAARWAAFVGLSLAGAGFIPRPVRDGRPMSAVIGAVNTSIQHRCPEMATHKPFGRVPVPCKECYSVHVTAEIIAWQPSVPSQSTNPTAVLA